ncbi:unnamed protein product [Polarella glacialis]|uniref:PA domain-containing protein n=1 Tax=Polarella glacialis TaxID=89957 RepID=A0A813FAZ8_POLGL|nr:unnamed protein product [Polarella glacialis]CAE8607599.1 unnamed protein product [Polarella glacialis]CAE8690741.1 unnamed protein product [Polarella glacialis]|eukprot:CAMPEP_0115090148 /NCGR_PEP_ID=MMETSP0227-20121206/25217_1 /TAXON_ID=89957 /ORGANISM="Polarella glacialis, Strain CCMP 1383" /LENGTH=525 /DNA_ID=CAMNT_0002481159 /DNA_START=48 /DNA_END=1625 /DNA_ORIENTATION=-
MTYRVQAVLVLVLGLLEAVQGRKPAFQEPTIAVVAVTSPSSLAGVSPGYFGAFSQLPQSGDLEIRVPQQGQNGCESYVLPGPPGSQNPVVALVRRGNCTFVQKALRAQDAGAVGLLVVMDDDQVFVMSGSNDTQEDEQVNIFAVALGRSTGDRFFDQVASVPRSREQSDFSKDPLIVKVSVYSNSLLNVSEAFLVLLATSLVALGAFFSTSDMRQSAFSAAIAPPQEEVLEVDALMAGGFFFMGSGMLVFLFFFMNYMIYVIIFAFCVGGASCITQFGSLCLNHFVPSTKKRVTDLPLVGPVSQGELISFVPALVLVLCWVTLRNTEYGWPFQDLIGAGFLCWMQRTLRLPNIKIASILLTAMFFFDIFWVFLSPLIFTKSVMVTVATGGDTGESVPMLLRIPSFGDPLGHDRLLGFGDIALPGLLVSFLRRHDIMSRRRFMEGYFAPSLVGYFVGLCFTITALMIMQMGQPALLYLVPCTLGLTLALAFRRGEVGLLWDGKPALNHGDGSVEDGHLHMHNSDGD